MTLTDAKMLLEQRRIPYRTAQYEDEGAYFRHLSPFSDTANGRNCKVTALVIPAVNGQKDIELQFRHRRGEYVFAELYFGGCGFELYDWDPDLLEAEILDIIGQIVDCKLAVIQCCDLKRKRWVSDACYDLTEDDNVFGASGYREAVAKIDAPKTFWKKLTGESLQYEIYDWRTCRQVKK